MTYKTIAKRSVNDFIVDLDNIVEDIICEYEYDNMFTACFVLEDNKYVLKLMPIYTILLNEFETTLTNHVKKYFLDNELYNTILFTILHEIEHVLASHDYYSNINPDFHELSTKSFILNFDSDNIIKEMNTALNKIYKHYLTKPI